MTDQQLSSTILNILKEVQEPLPTLEISKRAGFRTAKDVNPTLYSLLAKKQVDKVADEGGRNPRWILSNIKEAPTPAPTGALRQEILTLLEKSQEPLTPTCIKSQLAQPILRSQINAVLYNLQKEGQVTKTSNPDGTNPKWSLIRA